MSVWRRYEIFLPLRFNDGTPVPGDLIADTLLELRQRFGAVSCETQTIRGVWEHEGEEYRDDLIRLFVDVAHTQDCPFRSRSILLRSGGSGWKQGAEVVVMPGTEVTPAL